MSTRFCQLFRTHRVVVSWICLLLGIRLLAAIRHRYDIDEAQNLHLAYGWLNGEWPYRDRFDNHAPLFSMLFLPLAALFGETPHIVLFARLALFPVGLCVLWLVYRIGKELTTEELSLWAVAFCLALADWSLKSVEFRPDVLWAFFWCLAVWIFIRQCREPSGRGFFGLGIVLGLALCTSIKTTFLVPALAIGWLTAWFGSETFRVRFSIARAAWLMQAAGAGLLLPPVILFGWMISNGAPWNTIWFCLFEVNRTPLDWARIVTGLALAPVVIGCGLLLLRGKSMESTLSATAAVATGSYLLALLAFAPEVRKQTLLVAYPLLILLACRYMAFARWPLKFPTPRQGAGLMCAVTLVHLGFESDLWNDGLRSHRQLLKQVLALTDNDDFLMDGRGETIFAKRPIYLAFVDVVSRGIESKRLEEPAPDILRTTGTAVVIGDLNGFPKELRQYVKKHYLLVCGGGLRIAGQILEPTWQDGRWIARAYVEVPAEYVVVRAGRIVESRRVERSGVQAFDLGSNRSVALLLWSKAWDAGIIPCVNELGLGTGTKVDVLRLPGARPTRANLTCAR